MKHDKGVVSLYYMKLHFAKIKCEMIIFYGRRNRRARGCTLFCPKNLSGSRYTNRLLDCVDDTSLKRNVMLKIEDG